MLSYVAFYLGLYCLPNYLFIGIQNEKGEILFSGHNVSIINSCLLEILHAFLSSADFFQKLFFKKSFRNTIGMPNSLYPDQALWFVGPDLGPNCLQRLSADDNIM